MKFRSTYKFINGPDITNHTVTEEDYVYISDLIPMKNKSFFIENNNNPIWIYDMYLYVDTTQNNIYMPYLDYVKNFTNALPIKETRKYKFITLNVRAKPHRILCSAWINKNFQPTEYFYTACFNAEQDGIGEHLPYVKDIGPGLPFKEIDPDLPKALDGSSADIFTNYFYEPLRDSIFNIVNETSFWEDACSYNEKTHYAFLSHNIPIVSGYGAAHSLERIGFDMFTDIVNYSSQWDRDPFRRTAKLLDDNLSVLRDAHNVLNKDILYRLESNFNLVQQPDINKIAIKKLNGPKEIELLKDIMYNLYTIQQESMA